MKNVDNIVTVENALKNIFNAVSQKGRENASILDAYNRVLYEDVISDIDIPPCDNSAMDGYAIISEDSKGAAKETPVQLKIIDEIKAGDNPIGKEVVRNTAIRIMTGAPIPQGADAVIQFEDASEDGDTVNIYREVKRLENYRHAGEDIKNNTTVLTKGHRLKSADIGLLASLNRSAISVYKKPEVAIIATGDEVVDIGEDIRAGQIRNSNSYTLYSEIKRYNAAPHFLGIARDTIEDTKDKISQALNYDIIITTGGVSMGKYDFVNDVLYDLGFDISFEWVKMKPGKPCIFGKNKNTLFFGLPGNPVSTMISFIQFVRPAILKMMGTNIVNKPIISAILEEDIKKKPDRENYIRGYFRIKNGDISVTTTGPQGSGILRSMSEANCLIILPIGVEKMKAGERASVQLICHEEIE